MRRIAKLLLLVLALGAPHAARAQGDDRSFLEAWLEDRLSGAGREVRITGFEGALSARARIAELTIADGGGVWLTIRGAVLDWDRAALLGGRLQVAELSAEEIIVPRWPRSGAAAAAEGVALPDLPPAEAPGFALPELPVAIDIGRIRAGRVSLGAAILGAVAEVRLTGSASLADGSGRAALEIARIDGRDGQLRLAAGYANATGELSLDLALREAAGGIAATLLRLPGAPSVGLSIAGAGPLSDFDADIALATDGVERLAGQIVLGAGTAAAPATPARSFAAEIAGDLRPLLAPRYAAFLGDELRLSAAGRRGPDGALRLDSFALSSAAMSLAGAAELGPDLWPRGFEVTGRIAAADGAPVLLALPGPDTWLRAATLDLGFDAAAGARWSGSLRAEGFRRGATAVAALSVSGAGLIRPGDGAAIGEATGQIALTAEGLAPGNEALAQAIGAALTGRLDFTLAEGAALRLDRIALSGAEYAVSGSATVSGLREGLGVVVAGEIELAAERLARFSGLAGRPLAGGAQLRVTGEAAPLAGSFALAMRGGTRDLSVGMARLDPLLAGDGQISLDVGRDATGTRLEGLAVATPYATLEATATLSRTGSRAAFALAIVESAQVAAGLSGPARIGGTLAQDGGDWRARLEASGPGGAEAAFDGRAAIEGALVGAVEGTATAAVADLRPYADLAGRELAGGLELAADGAADLRTGILSATLTGTGRDLGVGLAALDPLLAGDSRMRLLLRREAGGVLVVQHLELATRELVADATGSLSEAGSRLRFSVDLRDLALFVPGLRGAVSAEGVAASGAPGWRLDAGLSGPGGTSASVGGLVGLAGGQADLKIVGAAPLALANMWIRPNLASGPLRFDLALAGPLALSSLTGGLVTEGASLTLPGLRLALTGIAATAQLAGGQLRLDAGAALASGGRVRADGRIGLRAPFDADLGLNLDGVAIRRAGLYETTADGRLQVAGPLAGGARIAGRVVLGPVEIRTPEGGGGAGAGLPGLIHRNEPRAVLETRARAGLLDTGGGGFVAAYPLDTEITASRVFVRGRGLDAELGGTLRLRGTTAEVIPEGRFDLVRGRLDILGKRLALSEASVVLRGDFDPQIRAVADTAAADIRARIVLEGPASAPVLTITSSPALPEDEVLARLLFGRELARISPLQALRLASAIGTLAGAGGAGIVDRLRSKFGLDDLDVTTAETGAAEVRAGKYISENAYSGVAVDATGRTEIELNLSVTPSLTVRGRVDSGGNTGIGVFFQRDY